MSRPENYDVAQRVMEIYAGVWERAPDAQGVDYWVGAIAHRGLSYVDVAQSFFDQPLIQEKYAGLHGDALLRALYLNIFRVSEPDAEGFRYWQDEIAQRPSLLGSELGTLVMMMLDGMWANAQAADTQLLYQNFVSVSDEFYVLQRHQNVPAFNQLNAEAQAAFLALAASLTAEIDSMTTPARIRGLLDEAREGLFAITRPVDPEPPVEPPVPQGPQPTAHEILMLELINQARQDPVGEAQRLGIDLNQDIAANQRISTDSKAPLAFNTILMEAARDHSDWMLNHNIFSHTGINGTSPADRAQAAGYASSFVGENISWTGNTGAQIDLIASIHSQHDGLFLSPGHRVNILGEHYHEVGIGQREGHFTQEGNTFLTSMITQKFGRDFNSDFVFLTGVIYNDLDNNQFYTVGEGLSGVTVTVNGQDFAAFEAGAYSIAVLPGRTYEVTFSGPHLSAPISQHITVGDENLKLDVINGVAVSASMGAMHSADSAVILAGLVSSDEVLLV